MYSNPGERALVLGAVSYLAALSAAMSTLSYDIWGAMVIGPVLVLIGLAGIRALFDGELRVLRSIMIVGLFLRFVGAAARYWVGFGEYGGAIDAARYHNYGTEAAAAVWSGAKSWTSVLPSGTRTPFVEQTTALIYTVTGTSRLAGFMFFSWLTFWGIAWFVKAACIAVPALERRRYALLCVLAPSLVYWPSSIGKEALMMLGLGLAALGFAGLFTRQRRLVSLLASALGLGLAACIRPHMAGIWIAGAVPALLVAAFARRPDPAHRRSRAGERFVLASVLGAAAVALLAVGTATQRFFNPDSDEPAVRADITSILNETSRRTSEAGSNFVPPTISGPSSWPLAVARTLTRPLLFEAREIAQLLSALEIAVLLLAGLFMLGRLVHLPRLLVRVPYLTFAITSLFLSGLAYSSFANLGVLTRQKSLLFPFILLLVCLPPRPGVGERGSDGAESKKLERFVPGAQPRIATDEAFAAARRSDHLLSSRAGAPPRPERWWGPEG